MNSAKDLLNELMLQDQIEEELKRQIEDTTDDVLGRKVAVKKEWEDFVAEFFPIEILKAIDKYCYRYIWVGCIKIEVYLFSSSAKIDIRYVENGSTKMMVSLTDGECTSRIFADTCDKLDYIAKELSSKHKLLLMLKDKMPEVYKSIADKRQVFVNETKSRLETIANTKIDEPQKKYKITIETIEI